MTDLIWIGNALYPRWLVIAVAGTFLVVLVGLVYGVESLAQYITKRVRPRNERGEVQS